MLVNDRQMQGQVPAKVTLKRFYRPEDISIDTAYRANLYELYASDETQSVEVDSFVGKCSVGVEASGPGEFSAALDPNLHMHVHKCSSKLVHVVVAVEQEGKYSVALSGQRLQDVRNKTSCFLQQ